MAGDWIKMTKDLSDKPEVRKLARLMSVSRFDVVGRLFCVWSWVDSNSLDGVMDITCDDIDDVAGLAGFADALRKVGWLEGRDEFLEFPNFDRHNGQTAKARAESNRRMAKSRLLRSRGDARCGCVAEGAQQGAQPEKRREEDNNIGDKEAYCGKPRLPKASDEVRGFLEAETRSGRVSLLPSQIDEAAVLFFNDMESSGWVDAKHRAVNNWEAAARAFAMRFAANGRFSSMKKSKSRRDDLWGV